MASFCKNLSGKRVYLLDGHFSLYFPLIRNLLDVKCFVDSGIREMLARRTRRNLKADYGGSRDDIIHYNEECVEPNYRRFLLPTKKYADIIIPNGKSAAGRKVAIKYCGLKAGVFVSVGKDIIHAEFPPEARPRRPHCGGGHPRH